ncbi:SIS domain-containing protein [Microbacterium sp.]|uniref:SIS domain-containing protein n=1 Tax=Microbacterium sp. TaxID=51671 RepID=UPI0026320DD7|nr:SIS domain-containing protein [Microbacterium sp.]
MSKILRPLRPIESDLVSTLEGAVAQRGLTQQIAAAAGKRAITRILFVGMGGSWASSVPVVVQLQRSALTVPIYNLNAAEFNALYSSGVGPTDLVIAASHSGGTPETVLAAQNAKARGALVVSVAIDADNALSEPADFSLVYGSERSITSAKYVLLSELAYSLREAFGDEDGVAEARAGLDSIPAATLAATEDYESHLAEIASAYAFSDNIYVLASGALSGLAYLLSVCYLVEMQWKKSTHFTTGDFFHGPFELAQEAQPYILFAGADDTRAHAERARTFLDTYNPNYRVLDVEDITLPGISTSLRGELQHIPMASITMRLADHFEAVSGHDLDARRYMHKVSY